MSQVLSNPRSLDARGDLLIETNLLALRQVLIRAEHDRAEADRKRDAQTQSILDQIKDFIAIQQLKKNRFNSLEFLAH